MSDDQRALNRYLQVEMFHSLGAYGVVADELASLQDSPALTPGALPKALVPQTESLNRLLADGIHAAASDRRHPRPRDLLGSTAYTPKPAEVHEWVFRFYDTAIRALGRDNAPLRPHLVATADRRRNQERRAKDKLSRFKKRRADAAHALHPELAKVARRSSSERAILEDSMEVSEEGSLHSYLLMCLADAHLRMHAAEADLSASFFPRFKLDREKIERELNIAICLNTFVYAAARSAPWVFAENRAERDLVISANKTRPAALMPPFCAWIPRQVAFLALFRRGYARGLLGSKAQAFNDYLKLQRLLRLTARTLSTSATRVPGSLEFLSAFDALAEYHMGELYRSDHAHTRAFEHYDRAHKRLALLESRSDEMRRALGDSRWRTQLLLSRGKALYELGRFAQSLEWYLRAWRNFLDVTARDSQLDVDKTVVDAALNWLVEIGNDPDISKDQLMNCLVPVADSLETVRVSKRLRGLAADILDRIGHCLLVLRIPDAASMNIEPPPADDNAGLHALSHRFLELAARYDPHSTLAHSNLLKARYQNPELRERSLPDFDQRAQWPLGGGDFERFARVYESILLDTAEKAPPIPSEDSDLDERSLARNLLVQFLTHTDNINVKLSQVYHYLTLPRSSPRPAFDGPQHALEFVCLRRYSSFFPFLPRPAAFRALGGGYFVLLHRPNHRPFGIAVDPGSDWIENLYRAGFALADVDMVIITHDHADHMAALDPLLSLIGYRGRIAGDSPAEIVILGNESVVTRYQFYEDSPAPITVRDIEDWPQLQSAKKGYLPGPKELQIESVPTGHKDTAGGSARAIWLNSPKAGSLTITSDSSQSFADEPGFSKKLLSADVFVAHMSSAPLPEIRRLASVATPSTTIGGTALLRLWKQIEATEKDESRSAKKRMTELANRIRFALWDEASPRPGRVRAGIFGAVPADYRPPNQHLYLNSIVQLAEAFRKQAPRKPRLFLISELREELGTFRTKIAGELNRRAREHERRPCALTADIGLRAVISKNGVEILCSTCDVDNDRTAAECFHAPQDISEVCVKGEEEGVFYNCQIHDPAQYRPPIFVERMERYDIFGRVRLPG